MFLELLVKLSFLRCKVSSHSVMFRVLPSNSSYKIVVLSSKHASIIINKYMWLSYKCAYYW
jgi:hypothetical protein